MIGHRVVLGVMLTMVAAGCGSNDLVAGPRTDPPPPVPLPTRMTSLTIQPEVDTIPVNTGRQFTAFATWSDGASGSSPVEWTTDGGSISDNGYYVAGSIPGAYSVFAKGQDGVTAIASVVVSALTGSLVADATPTEGTVIGVDTTFTIKARLHYKVSGSGPAYLSASATFLYWFDRYHLRSTLITLPGASGDTTVVLSAKIPARFKGVTLTVDYVLRGGGIELARSIVKYPVR